MANVKGVALVEMVKFLRSRRAEAEPLLPAELRHYLDERIRVASWYPECDMVGLVRVVARLLPKGGEPPLAAIGRLNARNNMAGAYRHLFESADLSRVPLRAVTLWRSMHDTGDFRVTLEEGEARVDVVGYGYPCPEMCAMIGPYVEELFGAAGVKNVRAQKRACGLDGAAACSYRIVWDSEGD
ncbi:MAG: hypothetical protein OZ948_03385 [Deltaproteobacteria bacterium]|nr:hypothetical protein [Deltaproteobacteria bacterium]